MKLFLRSYAKRERQVLELRAHATWYNHNRFEPVSTPEALAHTERRKASVAESVSALLGTDISRRAGITQISGQQYSSLHCAVWPPTDAGCDEQAIFMVPITVLRFITFHYGGAVDVCTTARILFRSCLRAASRSGSYPRERSMAFAAEMMPALMHVIAQLHYTT